MNHRELRNKKIYIYFSFVFLPALIISCGQSNSSNADIEVQEAHSEAEIVEVDSTEDSLTVLPHWIDTIIQNSQPRAEKFQCTYETISTLKIVDTTFLKEHLTGFKTDFPAGWELEFDPYSRYYYFDYEKLDSFILFTIVHNTEYGYDHYFTYTFDLESNKITTVSCTAQNGGDGGGYDNEHLYSSESGKELTVITQSYFDEDLFTDDEFNDCYSRSFDSIVTKFEFLPKGTTYSIDTVFSSMDTICQ